MAARSDSGISLDRIDKHTEYDYLAHANSLTEDDLLQRIEEFSNSYSDHGSVEAFSKRIPSTVSDIQVLHDTKPNDKLEDIGHKLYLNIGELLRAVDKTLFPPLIANNYKLADWILQCRENRNQIQDENTAAQTLAEETLLVPEHHIYDLRAKTEYAAAVPAIKTAFLALTEEERGTDTLKARLQEKKEEIAAIHDDKYLIAHDIYTNKLAAKNQAIVTYRAKQLELKHLYTFEKVLDAFQAAERQIFAIIQKAVAAHCIALKAILQGTARIPNTNASIPNPWDNQSLCGVVCIMHERFHKRSFVTFNNYLLDAMTFHLSEAETKSSPMKAVAEVQKMMYN